MLRHYCSFADKVIVHDGGPDWSEHSTTRQLCECHGAQCLPWDTGNQLNDELAQNLKNTCWRGTDADWVICVDCDELIWFPPMAGTNPLTHREGSRATLEAYDRLGAAVIKPHGFEMFSDTLPELGSHNQIYHAIRDGAPDDKWYAKPVLFSPRRVAESGFGVGAHESRAVLRDGRVLLVDGSYPKAYPATYLLHYHQIGPAEFIARRYDETRARFSQVNIRRKWGNMTDGHIHVQEKRALIVPHLRRVVM